MALPSKAGDVGQSLVTNTVADKVVYGDKQQQVKAILGGGDEKANDAGDGTVVNQKEFYWDQIVLVLVSAMLGLSFLEISIEFFRGSEVQCYFDIDDFTISKGNYINSYCYGSLPNTQYYLVFILISALVVIAPHYLWNAYFAANFDFFFDLIKKLDRLRDTNTGEYSSHNFERVKKLEEKFSNSQIFFFYKLKLVLQLFISLVALGVNIGFFWNDDFDSRFDCPKNCALDGDGNLTTPNCSDLQWPLNERFKCVYNSFRLLNFLHKTMYGLLGLMIAVLLIGLVWSGLIRHANELGAKRIADFCFSSCLQPEAFSFTSWKSLLTKCCCSTKKASKCCCCINCQCECFNPRIKNDLDFLLMRLFMADSGHGQVFKDIQISKHLRSLVSDDYKRLYLLNRIQADRLQRQITFERRKHTEAVHVGDDIDRLERNVDIKNHFFSSGFKSWSDGSEGGNPDTTIYQLVEPIVGARWTVKPSIRDVIFGFFQFAPRNKVAMDISFGTSTSYSLILARAFYDVATVHFNRFYKNPKQICRVDKFQANFRTITFQDDIFSQIADAATKSEDLIMKLFSRKLGGDSLDLILIGPMNSVSMSDTTNTLIEKMYFSKYFTEKLALLAIRPLMIGSHDREADYWQFKPSEDLFDDITDSEELSSTCGDRKPRKIPVNCDGVECIFEFRVFRYKGDRAAPQYPSTTNVAPVNSGPSNEPLDPSTTSAPPTLNEPTNELPHPSTTNNTLPTDIELSNLSHSASVHSVPSTYSSSTSRSTPTNTSRPSSYS